MNAYHEDGQPKWWQKFVIPLACAFISCGVLIVAVDYSNQQREKSTRTAFLAAEKLSAKKQAQATRQLYLTQLAACHRTNQSRKRINAGAIGVLRDFLTTAREARAETAQAANNPAIKQLNAEAAIKYTQYLKNLTNLPLIDCQSVIRVPQVP